MKKYFTILLLLLFLFAGCTMQQSKTEPKEQPHLYWKDIDVVVTNVGRGHSYARTHFYRVDVSVESEEYQLTYTDTFAGSGIFGCPPQWNYKEGDVVKAELYSWVMDSTGEVVRREIHRIY